MSIKETRKTPLTLEISILIWYVLSLTSCFLSWMVQHVIVGIIKNKKRNSKFKMADNSIGRDSWGLFSAMELKRRDQVRRGIWIYTQIFIYIYVYTYTHTHTHIQTSPKCKITWDTLCTSFPELWLVTGWDGDEANSTTATLTTFVLPTVKNTSR